VKVATALIFLFAMMVGHPAHAEKIDVQRPRWVIIATFFDRETGAKLAEKRLRDRDLEFTDAVTCKSIVDRARSAASGQVITVLTCREVTPVESYL
jgi:hypothetical protein